LTALVGTVRAGPVTFEFAGEITFITDDENLLGGAVTVGSPFSGLYTFESTTPDSDPDEPRRGLYNDAITFVSGEIAGIAFSGPLAPTDFVDVLDFPNTSFDHYLVYAEVELLSTALDFKVRLGDQSGTAFHNDSLPATAPSLALFDSATFTVFDGSETIPFYVKGHVTSFVPEPGAVVLLALGSLIASRRNRSRVQYRMWQGGGRAMRRMILSAIGLTVLAGTVQAGPVTFEFAGEINFVRDDDNLLGGDVTVGTPFSGLYTFESTTPDADPDETRRGLYNDAITFVSGEVAGIAFAGPDGPRGLVEVLDFPNTSFDAFGVFADVAFLGASFDLSLDLLDRSGTVFQSDALPTIAPDVSLFDLATFSILDGSETIPLSISGEITTHVPEPSTLALLGTGLLIALKRRKRRLPTGPNGHVADAAGRSIVLPVIVALVLLVSVPGKAVECNTNCDVGAGECDVTGNDCQPNGIEDEVDIAGGTSEDCNGNRIPDECEQGECRPIDVVFLFDTSSSVGVYSPTIQLLCERVDGALSQLEASGICVRFEKLALWLPGHVDCTCCESSVRVIYGMRACEYFDVEVLGQCGGCNEGNCEDWAPATAVVAAQKDWTPGPRIIIPISDEGPRCGDYLPDADEAAIHHAIPAVWDNRVIVGPVVPPGGRIEELAWKLSDGGARGGHVFDITDIDLAEKLAEFIRSACPDDCNGNLVPDSCDIAEGMSRDCDEDRIPDACQDWPDCQDPPNGIPDACDISCGVPAGPCDVSGCGNSTDCDVNCVPDECDTFLDCNGNGVQDSCDVSGGTSLDCGGFTHNCCIPHGGPGCTNSDIENCVCDLGGYGEYCCDPQDPRGWDEFCVTLVEFCESVSCTPVPDGIPDECQAVNSPDCDVDGTPNVCELQCGPPGGGCSIYQDCGTAEDCNNNCVPDDCEANEDCNANTVQDICDIAAQTSTDCNNDNVPDECQLEANDCNSNGVPDDCEPDDDCNANDTRDICDIGSGTSLDCNDNSVPDECDVAGPWSNDCNSNDVPDECESQDDCQPNCVRDFCDIWLGTSQDCNENGVPDECDIADGTSQDLNENGIPDVTLQPFAMLVSGNGGSCPVVR